MLCKYEQVLFLEHEGLNNGCDLSEGIPSDFLDRGALFDDLRDFNVNIEPLVYTPGEWQRLTTEPSVGFWQSAVAEMVRLF